MASKIWGDEYRNTLVCIDSYDNDVPVGRFYNPYIAAGRSFVGVTQFLKLMEDTLDQMDLPRSFAAVRNFAEPPKRFYESPGEDTFQVGAMATFRLRILFRQNVSWQGSLTWVEGKREQSFRSVLELILLINSAMTAPKAAD